MTTYWDINEDDVYVQVFNKIFDEIDLKFLDQALVECYQELHVESRYLVTRLFYRALKFVPRSSLGKYLPEDSLQSRIDELLANGFFLKPSKPEQVLEAASLKELIDLAIQFGVKSTKKVEIQDELLKKCKVRQFFGQKPLSQRLVDVFLQTHHYYKLSEPLAAELQKAMFLYLLPSYGASSDVVVRKNMRLVRFLDYEYYPQKERPLFESKELFESFYESRTTILDPLEEASSISNDTLELIALAPRSGSGRYSSAYVLGRATHLAARLLGKQRDFILEYEWTKSYLNQAIHRGKRSENWIRLLLLELKFFDEQRDAAWLRRGLNTYYDALAEVDEVYLIDLERKAQRLAPLLAKNGVVAPEFVFTPKTKIPVRVETATLNKSISNRTSWGADKLTVEETALGIYAQEGWEGGHYENGVISTFFMLLFHDILFTHRESFLNDIQSGPMSIQRVLDTAEDAVAARLEEDFGKLIAQAYSMFAESQPHIAGVNWNIPLECLLAISKHQSCKQLIRKLVKRYRISGFTDLTLWKDNSVKFVEVKSTNDVVSDTQYIWMRTLLELGMSVEICKIMDSSKKRKRVNSKID